MKAIEFGIYEELLSEGLKNSIAQKPELRTRAEIPVVGSSAI